MNEIREKVFSHFYTLKAHDVEFAEIKFEQYLKALVKFITDHEEKCIENNESNS